MNVDFISAPVVSSKAELIPNNHSRRKQAVKGKHSQEGRLGGNQAGQPLLRGRKNCNCTSTPDRIGELKCIVEARAEQLPGPT